MQSHFVVKLSEGLKHSKYQIQVKNLSIRRAVEYMFLFAARVNKVQTENTSLLQQFLLKC